MKKDEVMGSPMKSKPTLSLTDVEITGIDKLSIDDKISIALNVKIIEISRNTYDKERPLNVRAEISSGKILDDKVSGDIDEAKNSEQLEKAVKNLPKKGE